MTTNNLTKSQFRIKLQDPEKLLDGIDWESWSGIGMTSTPINTSNGRMKYMLPSKPQPKVINLSRAANIDDDYKIDQWVNKFCADKPIIQGVNEGTILIVVPLKACMNEEAHNKTIKVFNCIPTDTNMLDGDFMNTTDMSRTNISITWTHYTFS